MKKLNLLLLCGILLVLVAGCVADGDKMTATDVLKQNKDADIIQYDGFIFSNVTSLKWFEDSKENDLFSKKYFLGNIKKQTTTSWLFSDLSASKLPEGTKVYAADDKGRGMLFVEYEGEELYYLQLLEG